MEYQLGIPDIQSNYLNTLLQLRELDPDSYIYPRKSYELDPFLLDHMQEAAYVLHEHFEANDPIALIIDCDCDGYTSSAILYQYLREIHDETNITLYFHENKEHGLQDLVDDIISADKYKLVILPDSSSNDYEQHKQLHDLGIDILVLDHHEAEKYSEYAVVVNNQLSADYENKELTGAGVVYKFCEAYDTLYGFPHSEKYIDLAAIGIIGDMSPVRHLETRYITYTGLKNIQNYFLRAIIQREAYSLNGRETLTPTDISFIIAPLVNAVIRFGTPNEKMLLFQAFVNGNAIVPSTKRGAEKGEVETIAQQMVRVGSNAKNRQNKEKERVLGSLEMEIEKNALNENKIIIVPIEDDSIKSSLTGLLAMQIAAKYKKPTLVGRIGDDGIFKGSGRAPDHTHLTNFRTFLLDSGYFEYAEGHPLAFGQGIKESKIHDFTVYANDKLRDVTFDNIYKVEFIRNAQDADIEDIVMDLGQHPDLWAKGNEEPYIVVEDIVLDTDEIKIMGKNKDTISFQVGGVTYIQFKASELIDRIQGAKTILITIIGHANINSYMGIDKPQVIIENYNLDTTTFDF